MKPLTCPIRHAPAECPARVWPICPAGLPTYNDAREAYGLTPATSFADVTGAIEVQMILEDAYGGDIDLLDAYTGALAESSGDTYTGFLGDLLQVANASTRLHASWSRRVWM